MHPPVSPTLPLINKLLRKMYLLKVPYTPCPQLTTVTLFLMRGNSCFRGMWFKWYFLSQSTIDNDAPPPLYLSLFDRLCVAVIPLQISCQNSAVFWNKVCHMKHMWRYRSLRGYCGNAFLSLTVKYQCGTKYILEIIKKTDYVLQHL